jgi:heptosyltransferase-2
MKILVVQNKMGIGDMVIYLPFINSISKRFNIPISILVKESSKAEQFLKDSKIIEKIIILKQGNKLKDAKHQGFKGFFRLVKELREHNFDKIFIFNSSLRFNLIARFAGIKDIHQYPLLDKKNNIL